MARVVGALRIDCHDLKFESRNISISIMYDSIGRNKITNAIFKASQEFDRTRERTCKKNKPNNNIKDKFDLRSQVASCCLLTRSQNQVVRVFGVRPNQHKRDDENKRKR